VLSKKERHPERNDLVLLFSSSTKVNFEIGSYL